MASKSQRLRPISLLSERPARPFKDSKVALSETPDQSVYGVIERLVEAGEQAGFTVPDLILMLNGGTTLESLLDVIEVRANGFCLHRESKIT
jgi:hypothetical protein